MTTFDLAEVRGFAADLDARMNRCDNGEGMECANLDDTLRHYATLCCEFREGVRQWGRAVFAGRVAFDPEVERVWLDEGCRLYSRAVETLAYGQKAEAEGPCYLLDGQAVLQAALWDLYQLLEGWVTPKLAVGPSARQGLALTPAAAEEARRRIDSLPPLPADWQPADPRQQRQFKMLRKRRTS
jgi:hypothetical protein